MDSKPVNLNSKINNATNKIRCCINCVALIKPMLVTYYPLFRILRGILSFIHEHYYFKIMNDHVVWVGNGTSK